MALYGASMAQPYWKSNVPRILPHLRILRLLSISFLKLQPDFYFLIGNFEQKKQERERRREREKEREKARRKEKKKFEKEDTEEIHCRRKKETVCSRTQPKES